MDKTNMYVINHQLISITYYSTIATDPVEDFNITMVNNITICLSFRFLKGSTYTCAMEINQTNHSFKFNRTEEVEKCFSHSIPKGHYQYCVTCDGDYCIKQDSIDIKGQ